MDLDFTSWTRKLDLKIQFPCPWTSHHGQGNWILKVLIKLCLDIGINYNLESIFNLKDILCSPFHPFYDQQSHHNIHALSTTSCKVVFDIHIRNISMNNVCSFLGPSQSM